VIFPKGQPIHENLNTSFTQFDAMLADLKSNHFTGYMRVTAWEYEGILLFDTGNPVHAIDETKGARRSGPAAAETTAAKAREKDGAISVCRLSDEMVQVLAGLSNGEPVYKDLASDFTSLDKLIAKLQDEKHTGYVEVRMNDNRDAAIIFIRDGVTVESIFSNNGNISDGAKVLPQIIQATTVAKSLFTVYRTDLAQAYHNGTELKDSFFRQDLFRFWQDVLSKIETTVDSGAPPGTFRAAFKRACIAQANAFPFLDPFAAEFEFREDKIKFEGQATLAQLNQGLSRCVTQAVGDLTAMPSNKNLLGNLHLAMNELKTKYDSHFKEFGLESAAPELFG
jgi:hypothetical protein